MGKEYLWITSTWKCKKVACNTSRATNTPPAPTPPEASGGLRPLRPEVSGFGMECWGLKVWGSSESWVRVRVTGGGSPRINLMYHGLVPKGTTKDVHFIVVCNCSFHPKVSSLPTFPAL